MQFWKKWHHDICAADAEVAVALRKTWSDKQCCLSAELSFVNYCIMMAVREICNYSSLHFTFYSMEPNEVMLISDSFTGDTTLKTLRLKSIRQCHGFAFSSDQVRRVWYTHEKMSLFVLLDVTDRKLRLSKPQLSILFMHNELFARCRWVAAEFWSPFNLTCQSQSHLSRSSSFLITVFFIPYYSFFLHLTIVRVTFNSNLQSFPLRWETEKNSKWNDYAIFNRPAALKQSWHAVGQNASCSLIFW